MNERVGSEPGRGLTILCRGALRLPVAAAVALGLGVLAGPRAVPAEEKQPASAVAEKKEPVFRAGAAASNVTPWLDLAIAGSMGPNTGTYVHDELHARCLVLDDGKMRLAIVLVDNCLIPREVFDQAKQLVTRATKLPASHMLMAATHTHSAPCTTSVFQNDPDAEYNRYLARKIAAAVRCAIKNLEPAKIGWGVGSVPKQVFNRRWKMKEGKIPAGPFGAGVVDKVKMNPSRGSEDLVEPAGPTDPQVPVISVQAKDGRPIALLANYSLHYVGGVGGGHISADYFGMFADQIQRLIGADRLEPPFVGILSNGTSGDINNINFREKGKRQKPYEQMRIVANDVADEAYRVYQSIRYHDWVPLGVRQAKIELGVRLPTAEDIEKAKQVLAEAKGRTLRGLREIYARETVLLSKYPEKMEIILQALRIGDLAITSIPCEAFVEIGLAIKAKSPFKPTFNIQLANGYNGYLPTVGQHKLGGYETWRARSSYLEVQAEPKIIKTLLGLLDDLKKP